MRFRLIAGDRQGGVAIEYALIAAVLSIAIVGSLVLIRTELGAIFESLVGLF